MMLKGIDVSRWQGTIDFSKAKSKIDFVIMKCSQSTNYVDPKFEINYANAKANGIPVGVYHYLVATNKTDAIAEARFFMSKAKGKEFEYPMFLDMEGNEQYALSKDTITEIIVAFCDELRDNGFWSALYTNTSWMKSKIDVAKVEKYGIWRAHYRSDRSYSPLLPKISEEETMWQYSNVGVVSGISGNVDMDVCYVDYPKMIKNAGMNGLKKKQTATSVDISSMINYDIGDKVTVNKMAKKWATGQSIASFVKGRTYSVKAIKGGTLLLEDVNSWILISDVTKV